MKRWRLKACCLVDECVGRECDQWELTKWGKLLNYIERKFK